MKAGYILAGMMFIYYAVYYALRLSYRRIVLADLARMFVLAQGLWAFVQLTYYFG